MKLSTLGKLETSEEKLLARIQSLRDELSSIIYKEQFQVFENINGEIKKRNKKTKDKLLDEIIFLTGNINLLRTVHNDMKCKIVLDNLPQLIMVMDRTFKVIYVNNWVDIKESLMGKQIDKIFPGMESYFSELLNLDDHRKEAISIEIDYSPNNGDMSKLNLNVNLTHDYEFIITGLVNHEVNFENSLIGDYISMCAYCSNVKNIFDNWIEIRNIVSLEKQLDISHGICPNCYNHIFSEYL